MSDSLDVGHPHLFILLFRCVGECLVHQNIGPLKLKAKTLIYIDIGAANLDVRGKC